MTAFLIVGGIGIALLLISLVLGDFLEGILDFGGDWLGGATVAGFLGALGFGGALTLAATDNFAAAIGVGLASGLLLGIGVGLASAKLQQGGDNANVRSSDLVGVVGSVVNTIPVDGFGEVSLTIAGHLTKLNARCSGGAPIGAPITVATVLSPTSVIVTPNDPPATS